jgi:hypothetical protein
MALLVAAATTREIIIPPVLVLKFQIPFVPKGEIGKFVLEKITFIMQTYPIYLLSHNQSRNNE